jgi:hypothetical protein
MQERRKAPEPFVSAEAAAEFLGVSRRFLLSMARMGIPGAYPIGTGNLRRHWVFRISELTSSVSRPKRYDPRQGGSR